MIIPRHQIVAVLLAVATAGFGVDSKLARTQNATVPARDGRVVLAEVPQPDLVGVDPPAVEQIHNSQAALATVTAQTDASPVQRAAAFGSLGQVYQAYGFDDAALACYTNAVRLHSRSFRWFYYLGYLQESNGDSEMGARDYQRALALKPNDSTALLRLGNLELTLNLSDAARQLFTRALAQKSSAAAALTGLGKVALFERQFGVAQNYFAQALALEPEASSIHYQLAMAYRGLGDIARMQAQLQLRGDVEPAIVDPLLSEIDVLKQGVRGLMERAGVAMKENHFADAVGAYRQMVRIDPSNAIAYRYLGIALARSGQPEEALKQYARAMQLDPRNSAVHYNIGVLLIQQHKENEALTHFHDAIRLDPGLTAAHFQLANLLMRMRQDVSAEREYGIVVSLEPRNGFARLMQAMAAIHSGSYGRARTQLDQASVALPGNSDIANALARVLAAAPDPAVRDQSRALRIVQNLVNDRQGDPLEVGITLAMALAGAGRFREAVGYQQAIINQLETSRQYNLARSLSQNLIRYEQSKICTVPWADDDPVFTPVPEAALLPMEEKAEGMSP